MFTFFKSPLFPHRNQKEPENLKEVLNELKILKESYGKIGEELEKLKKENRFNIQKVGMVRFNPFKEVGGDQSFSIALLDADNNGFVITSHYGREFSRLYAKPIEQGASKYQLSKEEREAIEKAQGIKNGQ